jgi:hypothetical protein
VISAAAKSVLSLAFSDRCDVIVATVVAGDDVRAEPAVLAFLNGVGAALGANDARALAGA